jgi:polyferredoxin
MTKIGRPKGLIAYDNDINIRRRQAGKDNIYRIVRPRTALYTGVIAVVGAIMLYTLLTRSFLDINVLHDRNPVFVTLSDGSVRNAYTVRLLNKRNHERHIALGVEGLTLANVEAVGIESAAGGRPIVSVGPDQTRELRVLVTVPPEQLPQRSAPITFRATDVVVGEMATTSDNFIRQ